MSRLAQYSNQVQDGFGYEDFQPIPNGTELVMFVESAVWETMMNNKAKPPVQDEFIKVRYRVPETGTDYDNRVVFQKLHILGRADQTADKNATTEENALMMLAALDHICLGGALAKLSHDPEDEDLAKLEGKKVLVTVGINRFKNQFGEQQASNTVRMLAPLPARDAGGRAPREDAGGRRERTPVADAPERRQRRPR